jgi:hypothetical protein
MPTRGEEEIGLMTQPTEKPTKISLPDPDKETDPNGWVRLVVNVSKNLDESLEELAAESGKSVGDILLRSIALYQYLSEAHKRGKQVGVAGEGQPLEVEIVGF